MDELEIKTVVINNRRYFFFLLVFTFGIVAIGMFLAMVTLSFVYAAAAIIGAIFTPFIFQKGFRRDFTKTALLRFDHVKFSIDLLNIKTGDLERHNEIRYDEIKYFKAADSAKDDSAFLKLYCRNGQHLLYTFLEQGKGEKSTDIVEVFPKYFQQYNEEQKEEDQIQARPIFLATRNAKYYFIGLTILWIVAIIAQIIYSPKALPGTMIGGIALYLLIFLQRRRDIQQYNKMK